jgi:hypothetical protein
MIWPDTYTPWSLNRSPLGPGLALPSSPHLSGRLAKRPQIGST